MHQGPTCWGGARDEVIRRPRRSKRPWRGCGQGPGSIGVCAGLKHGRQPNLFCRLCLIPGCAHCCGRRRSRLGRLHQCQPPKVAENTNHKLVTAPSPAPREESRCPLPHGTNPRSSSCRHRPTPWSCCCCCCCPGLRQPSSPPPPQAQKSPRS